MATATTPAARPAAPGGTTGPDLYRHAKRLIPGGTQLLSKRPEMFLPENWPAYYSRAKGCSIWDLDGRELIDMTTMGIGACLLGYADDDVNAAVHAAVDAASMSSLNPPEEVELAELLCEIHPWAQCVRYARCGGESMAVAVRIARAYTRRQTVAICGYHGWSDWYLAANLASDAALDGLLLPGLAPTGVPRNLLGTTLPFHFGKVDELKAIVANHGSDLAAVVMEPMRYDAPEPGFLEEVKRIAAGAGAVLVFDEISSGWRHHLGGAHLKFGIAPDMAVFAKSISNGHPMAAIIGREPVMQAAQDSFISSTYWTERVGPVAALATIRKMRRLNLAPQLARTGQTVREGWLAAARKHGLDLEVHGHGAMISKAFNYGPQSQAVRTLYTQEMLDRGFLAGPGFYASAPHTPQIVQDYLAALDEAFASVHDAISSGTVMRRLRGPVAQSGFQRLT